MIILLKVHNREKHRNVDCSRYDNDKLGSVLEINEEVLGFNSQISMYEAICQNNILFTKEIDIENINLDFLDEAVKIANENDFVESRKHLYENEVNECFQGKREKSLEEEEIDRRFRAVMSKMAYQIAQSEIDEKNQGMER